MIAHYIGAERDGDLAKLIDKADKMPPEKIKELGNKAKQRVAERYTWERISGLYEQCFCEGK